MKLDRVTITGADDSIRAEDLLPLTERYPFVEWGLLYSKTRQGTPRYPSETWLRNLAALAGGPKLPLSAHLCGQWVRELVLDGDFTFPVLNRLWPYFDRVQLNFHGQFHKGCDLWHEKLRRNRDKQYILQYDSVNDRACMPLLESPHFSAVPLFDRSGGAGVVPGQWPKAIPHVYCGYAGGLGPDNLSEELRRIRAAAGENQIWIDMETKVRSEGDIKFDLKKVELCLEAAAPFVSQKD